MQRIAQELQFTEQPGKDMIAEMKERMRRDNVSTCPLPRAPDGIRRVHVPTPGSDTLPETSDTTLTSVPNRSGAP